MYVLDSSALIEMIKKFPLSENIMEFLRGEQLVTTSICAHEVLSGVNSEKDLFVVNGLFNFCEVLNHDLKSAEIGAIFSQDLKKSGKMMSQMDVLIAAICKKNNATLVTLDKKFVNIKGLDVKIIS